MSANFLKQKNKGSQVGASKQQMPIIDQPQQLLAAPRNKNNKYSLRDSLAEEFSSLNDISLEEKKILNFIQDKASSEPNNSSQEEIQRSRKSIQSSETEKQYKFRAQATRRILKEQKHFLCDDPFNKEELISSEYQVHFRGDIFFQFFFLHLIFFAFLGPILGLIMVGIKKKALAENMGFWGFTANYLNQVQHWAVFVSGCFACLLTSSFFDSQIRLPKIFLMLILLETFQRSTMIAARYATSSKGYLEESFKRKIPIQNQRDESVYTGWFDLQPHLIDREIKHSMARSEIENITFRVRLLHALAPHFYEKFTNYNYYDKNNFDEKEMQKISQYLLQVLDDQEKVSKKASFKVIDEATVQKKEEWIQAVNISIQDPSQENLEKFYPGRLILRDMILVCKLVIPNISRPIRMVLSCLGVFIILASTLIEDWLQARDNEEFDIELDYEPMAKYKHWCFYLYVFLSSSFLCLVFYMNMNFLSLARVDMKRKQYLMKVLSGFIEPNRLKLKGKFRLLPLFNVFDPVSMQSWLDCRIMILDIGLKFFQRLQLYITLYLTLTVILGGALLLTYFEIISSSFISKSEFASISFPLIIYSFQLYSFLRAGVSVNKEADLQVSRVGELKIILEKLLLDWEMLSEHADPQMLFNQTFKKALIYFKYQNQMLGREQQVKMLLDSIRNLQAIVERLELERKYNPMKIMGIQLTEEIMVWLHTGLATLLMFIIDQQFQLF